MPPPPTGMLQYTICRSAQYPQGVRRIRKRQSRQRLRCVRPYNRFHEPCPMPYFCRARRPRRVVSVLRKSPVKHPTRRGRCPHRPAPRRRTPPNRTPPLAGTSNKTGDRPPGPLSLFSKRKISIHEHRYLFPVLRGAHDGEVRGAYHEVHMGDGVVEARGL